MPQNKAHETSVQRGGASLSLRSNIHNNCTAVVGYDVAERIYGDYTAGIEQGIGDKIGQFNGKNN